MTATETKLLAQTGLLALVQVAHSLDALRYADEATFPGVLTDPLALLGIGSAAGAFALVAARRPSGRTAALLAGAAVALGFTLYHGIPFDLGVNNPYWDLDGTRADAIQWATVVGAIVAGLWTAHTAWIAPRRAPRQAQEMARPRRRE